MPEIFRNPTLYSRSPWYQMFIALFYILVIGGLIFLAMMIPGVFLFNPDTSFLQDQSIEPDIKAVAFVRYLLISQHLSLFIIPGFILIAKLRSPFKSSIAELSLPERSDILFVILLSITLFPVTGITGEFNSGMRLPQFLSGIEDWMKGREDMVERLFNAVFTQGNLLSVIINFLMVAVLPAIGEELIFRGVIQRIISGMFRSGHAGVWITAVLFSMLHFQFYGFIPRLILGVAYGYLFMWSGIIWLPVIAHFINNAVSMVAEYTVTSGAESVHSGHYVWAQLFLLMLAVIPVVLILNRFRRKSKTDLMQEQSHEPRISQDH